MQCPVDGTPLFISDRSGVEIDYCPTCRGVWLDRGKLDKILDRFVAAAPLPAPERGRDDDRGYEDRPRKKKRGGFLEELFDF